MPMPGRIVIESVVRGFSLVLILVPTLVRCGNPLARHLNLLFSGLRGRGKPSTHRECWAPSPPNLLSLDGRGLR
jgi:hypothetical protein